MKKTLLQAGVYRSQQLGSYMDDFVARLEHNAMSVAAIIGTLKKHLDDPK